MLISSTLMGILFGGISAYVAKMRGKDPVVWFFVGMIFGIFGLLFLLVSSRSKTGVKPKAKRKREPTTIDITPKIHPSYNEKFWYYLDPQNQQYGPMSFNGLLNAWKEGKVSQKTYVWNETLETWTPFGEFISP